MIFVQIARSMLNHKTWNVASSCRARLRRTRSESVLAQHLAPKFSCGTQLARALPLLAEACQPPGTGATCGCPAASTPDGHKDAKSTIHQNMSAIISTEYVMKSKARFGTMPPAQWAVHEVFHSPAPSWLLCMSTSTRREHVVVTRAVIRRWTVNVAVRQGLAFAPQAALVVL
jgi:hypothetical protein